MDGAMMGFGEKLVKNEKRLLEPEVQKIKLII
jgi:hypothetical protein